MKDFKYTKENSSLTIYWSAANLRLRDHLLREATFKEIREAFDSGVDAVTYANAIAGGPLRADWQTEPPYGQGIRPVDTNRLMKDALKQMLREMVTAGELRVEIDSGTFASAVDHVRGPTEWDRHTNPEAYIMIDDQMVEGQEVDS